MSGIWLKVYIGLHTKYPLFLSDFNEIWNFLPTEFRKIFKCKIPQKWEELRAVKRRWDITATRCVIIQKSATIICLGGGNPQTFSKIRPVGQPSCSMLTDRWTDIMKLKESLFHNFAKAPKNFSQYHFTHPNLAQYHLYSPKFYLSASLLTKKLASVRRYKKCTPLVVAY